MKSFFLPALIFLISACSDQSDPKDQVIVDYQVGQKLAFISGQIAENEDTIFYYEGSYSEYQFTEKWESEDTTYFKVIAFSFTFSNEDHQVDTLLISKNKYYQIQSFGAGKGNYSSFLKTTDLTSDTTKTPTLTRLQIPVIPVVLTEGNKFSVFNVGISSAILPELREFEVEAIQKIKGYTGILVTGKMVYTAFNNAVFPYKSLYDKNGKVLSSFYLGKGTYKNIQSLNKWSYVQRVNPGENFMEFLMNFRTSEIVLLK
ncbi:MAG: hypothetical protein J0L62_00280 [Bacteroidetes bacterium]|nr:hypothetical protein [Bacteroidota bacterium]